MPDHLEWIVPRQPVRDADRPSPQRGPARMEALRRQVREGYYASASMMEAVARRLLERGVL